MRRRKKRKKRLWRWKGDEKEEGLREQWGGRVGRVSHDGGLGRKIKGAKLHSLPSPPPLSPPSPETIFQSGEKSRTQSLEGGGGRVMGKRRGEGGDGVREDEGGSISLVQTENCRGAVGEKRWQRD